MDNPSLVPPPKKILINPLTCLPSDMTVNKNNIKYYIIFYVIINGFILIIKGKVIEFYKKFKMAKG